MHGKKRLAGAAALAIGAACLLSPAALAEETPRYQQEEFVISTFHGVPSMPNGFYNEVMFALKEVGMTHLETAFTSPEGSEMALQIAEELGLKVIVQDTSLYGGFQNQTIPPTTEEDILKVIEKYAQYESFGGYYVWDEPFLEQLDDVKKNMDWIQKHDPGKLRLVALLQSYSPTYWWPNGTFKEYIDTYVDKIDPDHLSFDYYVFDADVDNGTPLKDSYMWMDMAYIRKKALERDIPYWYYLQILDDVANPNINPQPMTRGRISFQVYTAMAYGATGIQYFNTMDSIVDDYGRRLDKFDILKSINSEIHNLGPTLMELTSTVIYPTIDLARHEYIGSLEEDATLVASAPGDMFFGEFKDDDGNDYLLPVNCDYDNPKAGTITLKGRWDVYELDAATGETKLKAADTDTIEIDYVEGGGALYALRPVGADFPVLPGTGEPAAPDNPSSDGPSSDTASNGETDNGLMTVLLIVGGIVAAGLVIIGVIMVVKLRRPVKK